MTELFQLFKSEPLVFIFSCSLLGLIVGSFLNVVIHRLPKMMERDWRSQCAELNGQTPEPAPRYNLVVPRSACPHCGHAIGATENIPVLSFLLLRGKCKGCGAAISPRYPIVEAISGILSAFAAWHFGFGLAGLPPSFSYGRLLRLLSSTSIPSCCPTTSLCHYFGWAC